MASHGAFLKLASDMGEKENKLLAVHFIPFFLLWFNLSIKDKKDLCWFINKTNLGKVAKVSPSVCVEVVFGFVMIKIKVH